jgi:hypothetical protein
MRNKFKFDKLLLDKQFEDLKKKKKADHMDVVLIASALQQQMLIEQGLYRPLKKITFKKKKTKKEETIHEFLPRLVNKNSEIEHDSEKQIYSRRKQFMSNLSLGNFNFKYINI